MMIHLHEEALVVIVIIVGLFGLSLFAMACLLGKGSRCCCCCTRTEGTGNIRQYSTLSELLCDLSQGEFGVVEGRSNEISIESFFVDILHGPSARDTNQADLEQTLL
jgi:hypothetical protein